MNINALLSPEEDHAPNGGRGADEPSGVSPQKKSSSSRTVRPGGKRTHSALSQEITRSPDRRGEADLQQQQQFYHYQQAQPPPQAPTSVPEQSQPPGFQQRPAVAHRPLSNTSVHSLIESSHSGSPQPPPRNSGAPPISRGISRQSLADLTMAEAPSQTPPPRDFSNALSDTDSRTVTDLLNFLGENSYAYTQHVELINLLHKGFLSHVYPSADDMAAESSVPQGYALLREMRQAREAMDTRFAVGEAIWADWLADEILLATTADERIALIELCQKALQDEPASTKLWTIYVDWISANYAACHDLEGADQRNWNEEDKELCKELFTKEMISGVLDQAVTATQWRIDESHLLWNRCAKLMQDDLPSSPSKSDVQKLHSVFLRRLQVPHAAWDETKQIYWPIVSRFEGDAYEAVFEQVAQAAVPAKLAMSVREHSESKLLQAIQTGDSDAIHFEFDRYLKGERFNHNKKPGPYETELRCGLYERALLSEPTNTEWWLDYVDFAVTAPGSSSQSLLPLIERATRHCPWSGELWARRILRADVERHPRDEIEATKHRATNAGLLDVGGMDELVKMLQEWCSYLRRHAFRTSGGEDDLDTAEMGISMALEDVQQAGVKLYGKDFSGDPLFRLEQIQIKFYTEARRFKEARKIYQQLATRHGHSFAFWNKYYMWELWMWGWDRVRDAKRVETEENGPDLASAVVQEALRQRNLDLPDNVLQLYLDHYRQHESGTRLQVAIAAGREFANRLAATRAKEAAKLAFELPQQHAASDKDQTSYVAAPGEKRKRDEETTATDGESHKKSKVDASKQGSEQPLDHIKRDREHNTLAITNLPADISEIDIKKFFRDCGKLVSVHLLPPDDGSTSSATVEFETAEDVLAAQTRDGKEIDGHAISIHSGGSNTLYVTNYPAEYEEKAIRSLFEKHGRIVSVRFPSLRLNARRRFCYVEFLTATMAKAASTAMDGMKIDGLHTLLAKISDPDHKQSRSGAQIEGRELFVKNFDRYKDSPEEIRKLFEQYGELEKFNLLRTMSNKLTGNGFVAYKSVDAATAAIKGLHNTPRNGRILHVELSSAKGRTAAPADRARIEDVIVKQGGAEGSRRGSDVSMLSGMQPDESKEKTWVSADEIKARKVAIFDLPDTVNAEQIKAVLQKYGPVLKIQFRREKEGAIVEFTDLKAAFNVRQGVDVSELGPKTRTGDVGDFLEKKSKARVAPAFVPPAAARAAQGRGGRRGGLGFKRGGGGGLGSVRTAESAVTTTAPEAGAKKSNSDFRSMLLESSTKKPESDE